MVISGDIRSCPATCSHISGHVRHIHPTISGHIWPHTGITRPYPVVSGQISLAVPCPTRYGHIRLYPLVSKRIWPHPAISSHMQPYPAIQVRSSHIRPYPRIRIQPYRCISIHIQPYPAMSGHVWQVVATVGVRCCDCCCRCRLAIAAVTAVIAVVVSMVLLLLLVLFLFHFCCLGLLLYRSLV